MAALSMFGGGFFPWLKTMLSKVVVAPIGFLRRK